MENLKTKLEKELKQAEKFYEQERENLYTCERNQLGGVLAMMDFYSGQVEAFETALGLIEEQEITMKDLIEKELN